MKVINNLDNETIKKEVEKLTRFIWAIFAHMADNLDPTLEEAEMIVVSTLSSTLFNFGCHCNFPPEKMEHILSLLQEEYLKVYNLNKKEVN